MALVSFVTYNAYIKSDMFLLMCSKLQKVQYRVTLVGSTGVGKTTLLGVLRWNKLFSYHIPSTLDEFIMNVKVEDTPICILISDTKIDQANDVFTKKVDLCTDLFILCYSIADRSSFNDIREYFLEHINKIDTNPHIVLVGLKLDMRDNIKDCVKRAEGKRLKRIINAGFFMECSSRMHHNVIELFEDIARFFYLGRQNMR